VARGRRRISQRHRTCTGALAAHTAPERTRKEHNNFEDICGCSVAVLPRSLHQARALQSARATLHPATDLSRGAGRVRAQCARGPVWPPHRRVNSLHRRIRSPGRTIVLRSLQAAVHNTVRACQRLADERLQASEQRCPLGTTTWYKGDALPPAFRHWTQAAQI